MKKAASSKKLTLQNNFLLGSQRVAYNSMADIMVLENSSLHFSSAKQSVEIKRKMHSVGRLYTGVSVMRVCQAQILRLL